MVKIVKFVIDFLENIVNFISSIFTFLQTLIVEIPNFLVKFFSCMPEFVQTGVLLIAFFILAILVLKIVSWIRGSTI